MPYTFNPFTGKLDYYAIGTGPAGAQGQPGAMGPDGEEGPEGMMIPGAPGAAGNPGATGATGPAGIGLDGIDGEEGMPIPGNPGAAGSPGSIGPQGIPGIGLDGIDGEEGMPIPGQAGSPGSPGIAGASGSIGMPGLDGEEGPEGMMIPGAAGPAGGAGAQGQPGVNVFVTDGEEGPEGMSIPGSTYTAGLLGISAGLTANTTINDTVTYTTGGVTLPGQVANAGYMWRVKAQGTFVAISSATARNAQIAPYWGSTALPAIAVAVLASVAQTTNWFAEFTIVGSSTTAVWTTGLIQNKIDYPAIVAGTTSPDKTDMATPASTTVTAGAQTIDLRFSMSVAVATDQWVVQQLTIERIR